MLGKLPRVELDLLRPKLDLVPLKMHQVLHEAGDKIRFGYFVEMGLLSIVSIQPNSKSVEVGLIGTGGFAGMPVVDGFSTSPHRCVVQTDGTAYRIEAAALQDVLPSCPELHAELNRYGQYLALQAMQIAACNGLHEVEARLARWLLMGQELPRVERAPAHPRPVGPDAGNSPVECEPRGQCPTSGRHHRLPAGEGDHSGYGQTAERCLQVLRADEITPGCLVGGVSSGISHILNGRERRHD